MLVFSFGCAIDDRVLLEGSGATSAGGSSSGAGTGGGGQTQGSTTVQPPKDLPECVYDGAVSRECETLVENAGFESSVEPWVTENGAKGSWTGLDATESRSSGSLMIVNGMHGKSEGVASRAARQCLGTEGGAIHDFAADVFIPEGQGEGLDGETYESQAMITVFYFEAPECTGPSIGNMDSQVTTTSGEWVHLQGSSRSPDAAVSLAVRLNTRMPFRQYRFEALFDNVLVRRRE